MAKSTFDLTGDFTRGEDFPNVTHAEWQAVAGASATKMASRAPADGFARQSLYTDADAPHTTETAPFIRGHRGADWLISQRITPAARGATNKTVLADLAGGAHALLLDFSAGALPDTATLTDLLKGVMLDVAPLSLVPAQYGLEAIHRILEVGLPANATFYLNYDPLAAHLLYDTPLPLNTDFAPLRDIAQAYPQARLLTASGAAYHMAGANAVQELAWAMASLAHYVRHHDDMGLTPQQALAKMTLTLSVDVDFFASLAKIRAARWMFATFADAIDAPATPPQIHAETSMRSFSNADPWVNILRATIAAMGATIAGIDMLTILPCSASGASDNALTRRLARNTQLILQEESHIGRVSDAAGGCWYVESLTRTLAEAAWQSFQTIEAAGGMPTVLANGQIAADLAAQKQIYDNLINRRQWHLVGASEFPNLDEDPLPPDTTSAHRQKAYRGAIPFETLRYAAQPAKPEVYLACLGDSAAFTPRANFAINLYAAAGVRAISGMGGTDIAAIADEFAASGAKIAIICGTDASYDTHAANLAQALRAAGVVHLALIGTEAGAAEIAGVDDTIALGQPILPFLTTIHSKLGLRETP